MRRSPRFYNLYFIQTVVVGVVSDDTETDDLYLQVFPQGKRSKIYKIAYIFSSFSIIIKERGWFHLCFQTLLFNRFSDRAKVKTLLVIHFFFFFLNANYAQCYFILFLRTVKLYVSFRLDDRHSKEERTFAGQKWLEGGPSPP